MTGVTLDLQPWQVDELRRYVDGPVAGRASHNLVRRGFLVRTQLGTYAITQLGREALRRGRVRTPHMVTDSAGVTIRYTAMQDIKPGDVIVIGSRSTVKRIESSGHRTLRLVYESEHGELFDQWHSFEMQLPVEVDHAEHCQVCVPHSHTECDFGDPA